MRDRLFEPRLKELKIIGSGKLSFWERMLSEWNFLSTNIDKYGMRMIPSRVLAVKG